MNYQKKCYNCEHWQQINSQVGNCLNSNLVASSDRLSMLGIQSITINIGAGHVIVNRSYCCSNFKDDGLCNK